MPLSKGEKARRKLAKGLKKIANAITIETVTGGSTCPGALDPLSNEWDPKRDRAYHAANPSAPVCETGTIAPTKTTKTVLGFHFTNLRDAELKNFGIGSLDSNEAVFLVPYDQDVTGIQRYQAPTAPFPWYVIEEGFSRSVPLNNVDIFWIARATKE